MSTKTTFKRVALVTVAALGFGLMSVVPSQAVTSIDTLSLSSATAAQTTAETYTVAADKFGGTYKIVGNTFLRNETTGADEKFQMVIPKAKLKSGFNLNFSSDSEPSVFDMNLEILKDSKTPTMITMVKY